MAPCKCGRIVIAGTRHERKKASCYRYRKLPDVIETGMMELFETRLNLEDTPMSQAELSAAVAEADVLDAYGYQTNRQQDIVAGGRQPQAYRILRCRDRPHRLCGGRKRNITVTNTPGVLTEDTADMTMALILAVPRRLSEGERMVRAEKWDGWGPTLMLGHRIWGKHLGIVGIGRIGQAVAHRARRGFGLSIHYHNRQRVHPETESELRRPVRRSLDQMLAHMDIISIQVPAHARDLPSAFRASPQTRETTCLYRQYQPR